MSNPLYQPLPNYRQVQTVMGDTLQSVATRELRDAERWYELIYLNSLHYPYLTDDPAQVTAGVLQAGATIRVPSATAVSTQDPAVVYGSDVNLADGDFSVQDGDLSTVSGLPNLLQAVRNRLNTPSGELEFHSIYGVPLEALIAQGAGPNRLAVGALVQRSLLRDDRIDSVLSTTTTIAGTTLSIAVNVQPVLGSSLEVTT